MDVQGHIVNAFVRAEKSHIISCISDDEVLVWEFHSPLQYKDGRFICLYVEAYLDDKRYEVRDNGEALGGRSLPDSALAQICEQFHVKVENGVLCSGTIWDKELGETLLNMVQAAFAINRL